MSSPLLITVSALISLLIGSLMVRDLVTRKRDVLSIRNFFLLGVLYFYGVAGIIYGISPANFPHVSRGEGMTLIALSLPVFMGAFFLGEKIGDRLSFLGKVIPPVNVPVSSPALILSIAATMGVGMGVVLALRSGDSIGYTSALILQFRGGMAACAMGLATYYLVSQRYNPIAWTIFVMTFVFATIVTTFHTTGRRDWLAIFFAVPWTWYYATLRYRSLTPIAIKFAPIAAVTLVVMITYSTIRHDYGKEFTFDQRVGQLVEVAKDPLSGMGETVTVLSPDTPAITAFIFENYPDSYETQPLHGLMFMISIPFPRALWPEKPSALGLAVQDQLNDVANLGPGILGHGWSEMGWFGIIYYGVFFGAFVTVIDGLLVRRASNPFFVAIIGAALGNVMALPRGDTPLFLVSIFAAWISTTTVIYFVRYTAGAFITGFPSIAIPPPLEGVPEDEYDEVEEDYDDQYAML